jgi:hypothetical protein
MSLEEDAPSEPKGDDARARDRSARAIARRRVPRAQTIATDVRSHRFLPIARFDHEDADEGEDARRPREGESDAPSPRGAQPRGA